MKLEDQTDPTIKSKAIIKKLNENDSGLRDMQRFVWDTREAVSIMINNLKNQHLKHFLRKRQKRGLKFATLGLMNLVEKRSNMTEGLQSKSPRTTY